MLYINANQKVSVPWKFDIIHKGEAHCGLDAIFRCRFLMMWFLLWLLTFLPLLESLKERVSERTSIWFYLPSLHLLPILLILLLSLLIPSL
jgi:hypothetical protein